MMIRAHVAAFATGFAPGFQGAWCLPHSSDDAEPEGYLGDTTVTNARYRTSWAHNIHTLKLRSISNELPSHGKSR